MSRARITYRDFYDVPRLVLFRHRGMLILLDSSFDDGADDYSTHYTVYLMPELADEALTGSWATLPEQALETMGKVPVNSIQFDSTSRKEIDVSWIDALLPQRSP